MLQERLLSVLRARQEQLAMQVWEFPEDRFPLLDPTKRLDWEDKHIYAFGCKTSREAEYWFDRMVAHTVATENREALGESATSIVDDMTLTEDDARVLELGRLRLVATNGLGNPNVDTDMTIDFVYRMFILPMSERFGIPVENAEGWGTDKSPMLDENKIAVPDMTGGVEAAIQSEVAKKKAIEAPDQRTLDKLLGKGKSFTDRLLRRR